MKRGKDDEKITGPMFPRLHVNDTEKGGPRAPPRNKMALYEQLSIPSQRFNSGVLPLNSNNSANLVPSTSSSLRSGLERNMLFPLHLPSSMPSHLAEKFHACHSDGVNLSNPLAQLEQRKKVGDEDDFMVPVFVHSGMGQCHSKRQNGRDSEKLTPFSPSYSNHSMKLQDVGDKDPKRTSSAGLNLRQEARSQSENNPKECLSNTGHSVQSATNLSTREKLNGTLKEANVSPNQKDCDYRDANLSRLHDSDPCLQSIPLAEDTVCHTSVDEQMRDIEKGNVMRQRSNSRSGEIHSSPSETDNDTECPGDRTHVSLQTRNMDKGDDVSETSIVDSILGLDISPDDVVGIIGQKHFWKARRAIVNQQRVFGFQVFELHRLIKVQRLIAESPHILHEDGAFLKPSLKGSPAKKFPAEYVMKPLPDIVQSRDESEKPTHKMECSAEKAVGKTSLSTMKNGSHPSNYGPYFGNPPPNWCYPSAGHQWLLPVMSPSEGLVYKPYPVPGFTGTGYGGCGPFGPTPMAGNFMNPSYGVPGHHHNQGIGVGHSYFPPYGMLVNPAVSGSAVEQMNWFAGPGSHGQTGQLLEGGANCSIQRQSSCNVPTKNSGAVPEVVKFPASKDSELQGSTASSPSERERGVGGVARTTEGRDALQLFPVALDEAETEQQPTRVIKVVPHNPRSATESAARIFQSIQEERKQHDSI